VSQRSQTSDGGHARLFDLSLDPLCVAGFDGYLKLVNPAYSRMLGYSEQELLATPFLENVHPDDAEAVQSAMVELAGGDDVFAFECRLIRADGSVLWVEWNTRTRPEEGVVYAVGRDVTDRHVARTQLSALRRLATLVAEGVEPQELFSVVAEEVARVVGVPLVSIARYEADGTATEYARHSPDGPVSPVGRRWSLEGTNVLQRVRESSGPARIDDHSQLQGDIAEEARRAGSRSSVGIPIAVAGSVWGAIVVSGTERDPLPESTEARLAEFTELLATAVENAESREALARLVGEQTALRRVATLVAEGLPPARIVAAVSDEVDGLFGTDTAAIVRFDHEAPAIVVVAAGGGLGGFAVGTRWELDDLLASTKVFRTGRAARVDHEQLASATGPVAEALRSLGAKSTVASPIMVERGLWGAITIASKGMPLPPDTEGRLEKFTELVATAIANAESREALGRLAEEQAALRRMATLVARAVPPAGIFAAVSDEVGRLFGTDRAAVDRFDYDGPAIVVVGAREGMARVFPVGSRWEMDELLPSAKVFRTGRAARMDVNDFPSAVGPVADLLRASGIASTVASPIVVDGRLWGAITASITHASPPGEIEERLEKFTELVATAIANAESREALRRLADEQAALRRVATLVAEGVPPARIFAAVSDEVGGLFGTEAAAVVRYDHEARRPIVVVAAGSGLGDFTPGTRWELDDVFASTKVFRTRRAVRVDRTRFASVTGPNADALRSLGTKSTTVASPIVVQGRLWGAMEVSGADEHLPDDTGKRLENFTELVATAIANADSRSELAASRRRIVAASDDARRRIERDLHDGMQQRLVSLALLLRAAGARDPGEHESLRADIAAVAVGLTSAVEELQEISRGIHPAILSQGGLGPALRNLAHQATIPVRLDITTDIGLPEPIEVAAYYVMSEALANATKHARPTQVEVSMGRSDGTLLLSIRDDGVGGAKLGGGTGLVGLSDRVDALGGIFRVSSPPGDGTQITVELPLELQTDAGDASG
jgi:PAS domain S-box-containing protein